MHACTWPAWVVCFETPELMIFIKLFCELRFFVNKGLLPICSTCPYTRSSLLAVLFSFLKKNKKNMTPVNYSKTWVWNWYLQPKIRDWKSSLKCIFHEQSLLAVAQECTRGFNTETRVTFVYSVKYPNLIQTVGKEML